MTHDDWLEWLVVAGLAIWFAGTVVYQIGFDQLQPVARRFDVFRLLVGWRLFSGIPQDLRVWYRDADAGGAVGAWQEIALERSRCWHRAVWNPEVVPANAVGTFAEGLAEAGEKVPRERLLKQPAVLGLWMGVRSAPWPAGAVRRQFELREVSLMVPEKVVVVFTSDFWPADGGPGAL